MCWKVKTENADRGVFSEVGLGGVNFKVAVDTLRC